VSRTSRLTTSGEGVQIPVAPDTKRPLLRIARDGPTAAAAEFLPPGRLKKGEPPLTLDEWARIYFAELWDETNGAGAWERNDWCWCVSFEPTEAPRG